MSIERGFRPPDAEVWKPKVKDDGQDPDEDRLFQWPPIEIEKPDPEVVKRRRKALLAETMVALIHIGHAGYLDDAAEALRGLREISPDEAALIDEVKREILELLPRLTRRTLSLLDASQPTDPEAGADIPAARSILRSVGFAADETNDVDVKQILGYRHLLLELKE